jgi:hypothetical protein
VKEIHELWLVHKDSGWPSFADPNQGALMTLDTVISGCATYYLDSEDGLDPQRVGILEDCLADLNGLLPGLTDDVAPYFERLQLLASLLLETKAPR